MSIDDETLEDVVARIRALPKTFTAPSIDPQALGEALRSGPSDEDFDLEEWQKAWAEVEIELRNMTLADELRDSGLYPQQPELTPSTTVDSTI